MKSTSPKDILRRIAILVAKASTPEKEESRSMAQEAVAMMRQYGVRLVLGEEQVVASARISPDDCVPMPPPPPKPTRRTIIVYRCSGCGSVVQKPGLCAMCVEARRSVGIWTVTCEGCGRQAPGAGTVEKAHDNARAFGYEVTEDDRTLCPECFKKETPWQRAAR